MNKKCTCSRRNFISSSTKAVLGAAVCSNLLGSCNKTPVDIIGDDENKILSINIDSFPDLMQIGGFTKHRIPSLSHPILLHRKSETEVIALMSACTHKGVEVELPDSNGISTCPGDGARFDIKSGGKALSPSITTLNLKKFDCIFDGKVLTIYG